MTVSGASAEESAAPLADRASRPVALHFLTLYTENYQPWLAVPRTRDVFLAVLRSWHEERNGRILAATIMPDHSHVLVELGNHLPVDQVISGWKASTRRAAGYPQTFRRDFRAYPVRDFAEAEQYALYIYLHPYRARLCYPTEKWPGNWLPDPSLFQFGTMLGPTGTPPVEWVEWPDERFARLAHGE